MRLERLHNTCKQPEPSHKAHYVHTIQICIPGASTHAQEDGSGAQHSGVALTQVPLPRHRTAAAHCQGRGVGGCGGSGGRGVVVAA